VWWASTIRPTVRASPHWACQAARGGLAPPLLPSFSHAGSRHSSSGQPMVRRPHAWGAGLVCPPRSPSKSVAGEPDSCPLRRDPAAGERSVFDIFLLGRRRGSFWLLQKGRAVVGRGGRCVVVDRRSSRDRRRTRMPLTHRKSHTHPQDALSSGPPPPRCSPSLFPYHLSHDAAASGLPTCTRYESLRSDRAAGRGVFVGTRTARHMQRIGQVAGAWWRSGTKQAHEGLAKFEVWARSGKASRAVGWAEMPEEALCTAFRRACRENTASRRSNVRGSPVQVSGEPGENRRRASRGDTTFAVACFPPVFWTISTSSLDVVHFSSRGLAPPRCRIGKASTWGGVRIGQHRPRTAEKKNACVGAGPQSPKSPAAVDCTCSKLVVFAASSAASRWDIYDGHPPQRQTDFVTPHRAYEWIRDPRLARLARDVTGRRPSSEAETLRTVVFRLRSWSGDDVGRREVT
jgi:hypothetical protein